MPIIYQIIYIPWKDNIEGKPWLYSGSDYHNREDYLGSASSKQITKWSNGKTIKQWWIDETKNNPQNFIKEILFEYSNNISPNELRKLESNYQKQYDHANDHRYFNVSNKSGPALNKGYKRNKPAWNKGLSAEKSESIKIGISKMIIKRQKQKMGKWITNGIYDKKLFDSNLPQGWRYGRSTVDLTKYKGDMHSQKGSFWVNNGHINKKLPKDSNIPEGYIRGRVNVRKK